MTKNGILIIPAKKEQASEIASLIMEAMDYDCCQNFAGPNHTLEDFHRMMTHLVEADDSQYSYQNTLVAELSPSLSSKGDDGKSNIAGCIVGYDGKDLLRLRKRFIEAAKKYLGQDYSEMDEETKAGEYYIDSLCVKKEYRKRGIATQLIHAEIERHNDQPVGLLVDHTHPWAEKLYLHIGFRFVNETEWGGHAMNHLQYPVRCREFGSEPIYMPYHDEEWGTPCHNEHDHFMYLLMESMSCGLSWRLMLQKREIFRKCFAGFDPKKVASFTVEDINRIMSAEGMIRSPRKIKAMINNARRFVEVEEEFGSFDKYIWSFTNGKSIIYPSHQTEWVTRNELSDKVSADLKKRGFQYVGSIIIYSHLQSIGIINDHRDYCFRYKELLSSPHEIVD